jgi:UDP-N-acetylmuramoyl-L-alanyl-D-glutamate--2,6-diaminopimelate ligase
MYYTGRNGLEPTIAAKGKDTDIGLVALENEMTGLMRAKRGLKPTQEDNFSLNKTEFIQNAIHNGAVAVVCSKIPDQLIDHITYVEVENSALAAGIISHHFFGNPSEYMKVCGVTGTNGKTTIVTLLWKLFTSRGYTCGLISTIQNQIGDQVLESTHTTPDAISIHRLLGKMKDAGCTHVFME